MKISQSAYSGEADKQQMALLVHGATRDNLHVMDMPYRFCSWALDDSDNIGLWTDETGRLAAWAVMQTPFWTIDYAYLPSVHSRDILPRILAWSDDRARRTLDTRYGHPMWFINVCEGQNESNPILEEAGFACQANVTENPWSKVFMARSAQTPVTPCSLPAGIMIRPLAGESEIDAYVELHRRAFGSKAMTREWRSRILQRPGYGPDLDLVAVNSDGQLAAFCICWFAESGKDGRPAGQIEPLGVHPAFHGQGLGRAILAESLHRLHRRGAEQVYVETDNDRDAALQTYHSAGFHVEHNVLVYRKDYSINA